MFLPAVREGDWTQVRKNFQKLSSIKLGDRASVTHAELTLTGLTASQLIQTDADKKLTSIALPLIVAKGGTGAATLTDGGILLGSGTGAITALGVASNGQIPIGDNSTDPVLATLTGTGNQITVTNGAGSITLSTPQDIHTGASPIFTGLTLSGLTQGSILFAGTGGVISEDNSEGFYDSVNKRWGFGTNAPNAPLEVKGAKPAGNIGGFQSGMLHVTGTGTDEFSNSVITGHSAFNGNTQLWYLGSTTINNNDIAFINRQNAPIHFYTNNTSRMTIDAAGNVTLAIIAAEGSDVDKFLVSSSGVVKYRTGADVLSDIGASASGHNHSGVYEPADAGLTSLAGLTYAADSFIKVTATDTYAIRTIAETKTDLSLNNVENTAHSTDAHTMSIDGRDVSVDGNKLDGIEALADVTATNETSHADVLQDGDFGSNGLMERTGAGSYGIKVIGTDVQAYAAGLASLAGLSYVAASFVKMTGADTFVLRTLQETSDDLEATIDHDNLLNFAANEHYLQSAITEVGTIATGTWQATDVGIAYGGTGQSTAQAAINALTAVSGATNEHVLTKDTATGNATFKASTGGSGGYVGYIKLSDVKAQNTGGGTFTTGAWQTRTLNTEDTDTGNDCTLNANQITLAAGTYECSISCPAYYVNRHQTRLYNTTGAAVVLIGTSAFTLGTSNSSQTYSSIVGRFTIAASQALEVQHRCESTFVTRGLGVEANLTSEIYTIAEFWRVS